MVGGEVEDETKKIGKRGKYHIFNMFACCVMMSLTNPCKKKGEPSFSLLALALFVI